MSDFIKLMELANICGVHRTTVYRWIARGVMPTPIKLGINTTAWNRFVILDWLQNRPQFVTRKKAANNLMQAA